MKNLSELLQATGLRIYSEGIQGVEVHYGGDVVFTAKNKPAAHAYVQGWYDHANLGRATTASTPRPKGEEG